MNVEAVWSIQKRVYVLTLRCCENTITRFTVQAHVIGAFYWKNMAEDNGFINPGNSNFVLTFLGGDVGTTYGPARIYREEMNPFFGTKLIHGGGRECQGNL